MEAATDPPPLDLFLYFPLPLPEFDLEYTTDFDLARNFLINRSIFISRVMSHDFCQIMVIYTSSRRRRASGAPPASGWMGTSGSS